MVGYIQLNYLSPISNYIFDNTNQYVLVFYTNKNEQIIINKILIEDINNISDIIRAFNINKTIKSIGKIHIVKLFCHNNNKIFLLFTGKLIKKNNFGKLSILILNKPINCNNELLHTNYINDISYLENVFFNLEKYDNNQICVIFYTQTLLQLNKPIKPVIINANIKFTYNRYDKIFTIDTKSSQNKYCGEKRILRYDPYNNNALITPIDGKLRAFHINKSTVFNINNLQLYIHNIIDNFHDINGGSGYVIKIDKNDYKYIHTPYNGYLIDLIDANNMIIFKFKSNYFIPDHIKERDYLSVVNGNFTYGGVGVGAGSRMCPQLIKPQPKIELIVYLILFQSVKFTNKKIISKIKTNNLSNLWFGQGEELGYCINDTNYISILVNRPIEFASDISIENNKASTFIKAMDIIGYLK